MSVDQNIKQLMLDLENALSEAISKPTEIGEAVRKIRQQGYSLHLMLDRPDENTGRTQIELVPRRSQPKEAVFMLDKGDVSMLRSLGIDPTRSLKRRRS